MQCGRVNSEIARFCDACGRKLMPWPPVPPPVPVPDNQTKEISRFWLALVQTLGSLALIVFAIYNAPAIQAQPWLIAIIASIVTGSNGVTNWYFGQKATKK